MTSSTQLSMQRGPPPAMGFAAFAASAETTSGASFLNVLARGRAVGRLVRSVTSPAKSLIGLRADAAGSAGRWFTLGARRKSTDSATIDPPPGPASEGVPGDVGEPARIFLRSGASSSDSYLSEPAASGAPAPASAEPAAAGARRREPLVSLTKV